MNITEEDSSRFIGVVCMTDMWRTVCEYLETHLSNINTCHHQQQEEVQTSLYYIFLNWLTINEDVKVN